MPLESRLIYTYDVTGEVVYIWNFQDQVELSLSAVHFLFQLSTPLLHTQISLRGLHLRTSASD